MKPKPNLAFVLDDIPPQEAPKQRRRRKSSEVEASDPVTVLVGANLDPSYAQNLAFLHAETRRSKKDLLQEALDMLFVAKGGRYLKL